MKSINYDKIIDKLNYFNYNILIPNKNSFKNMKQKGMFLCNIHNYQWECRIEYVYNDIRKCKDCLKENPIKKLKLNEVLFKYGFKLIERLPNLYGLFECLYGHQWEYQIKNIKYKANCTICANVENRNENLLINKHPNLIKEWNFELNINININTILYSSHKKVYWKCDKNHVYLASLNNRTKSTGGSNCSECKYDSSRVHDKETLHTIKINYNPKMNTTLIGDNNEKFIANLLLNTNTYKNVEIIGNTGGNADIAITQINNLIKYIQIKTLTKNNFKDDSYYFTNDHKYPNNMLIIMSNKEHTRFAIEFAGNIKVKRLALTFNYKKSKYKNIMFENIHEFTQKILELIPQSCDFDDTYLNIKKEKMSLMRLEQFCISNNLIYKRNETNGNAIDCFINDLSIQTKFVSLPYNKQLTYNVTSSKSCGRLNNKNIKRNYEENDFDMMVVEIGGTIDNTNKYINNFCFIPKNILIKQNILKTKELKGKKAFCICPPDYEKKHWSKDCWNNISYIMN